MDVKDRIENNIQEFEGKYVLELDRGQKAELMYTRPSDTRMVITYTSVPQSHSGQGIGQRLISRAVTDARATGFRIVPLCGYVADQFATHPEWSDVLDKA